MLGSRVCLQLLLGWALLLGQPVSGVEEDFEEPHVALEDDLEEPENPLDENLVEDALLETMEDLAESGENSEELERRAEMTKERLEMHGDFYPRMGMYKRMALLYYNKHNPGPLYRHLEDTQVKIERAVGTVVTFTMFLVNTNCTKEEAPLEAYFDPLIVGHIVISGSRRDPDLERCELPPESEQEKRRCTFTIYLDGRGRRPAVIDYSCVQANILSEPPVEE